MKYNFPLYSHDKVYASNPGTVEVDDFRLEYKSDGGVRLKKVGTKPLYEIIQANISNCELSSVLEKCVHQNQLAVCDINDVNSAIADFSGLSSMAEWYSGMKNMESVWSDLPLEVREQFNSSPRVFMDAIAKPDFEETLSKGFEAYNSAYAKRIEVVKPDVVIPDVSEDTITKTESEVK